MNKIAFKNPHGATIYLAKVGFDWGAFWGIFLYGLPFFLRKMNMFGFYCLGLGLILSVSIGLHEISAANKGLEFESFSWLLILFAFSLYFGIRGGKITARHYVEEGYKCLTKDDALLARAKAKWGLDF